MADSRNRHHYLAIFVHPKKRILVPGYPTPEAKMRYDFFICQLHAVVWDSAEALSHIPPSYSANGSVITSVAASFFTAPPRTQESILLYSFPACEVPTLTFRL